MEAPRQSIHVRSVSMPTTSHPTVLEVEEKLNKLRAISESSSPATMTAEMFCGRLTQVSELYHSINSLLQLPSIQHTLLLPYQKDLESNLEGSVRMLDACGALKGAAATLKEHVQGLQLVLRRVCDSAAQEKVHAYIRSRKETQKAIKKSFKVKQIGGRLLPASAVPENSEVVMKILSAAREITTSLLCSIMSFMSMPNAATTKSNKWSLISKTIQRKRVTLEADPNGMHCLDITVSASLKDAGNAMMVQNQLEATEIKLGGMEDGLECLFRKLIQNRVLLLNILSL